MITACLFPAVDVLDGNGFGARQLTETLMSRLGKDLGYPMTVVMFPEIAKDSSPAPRLFLSESCSVIDRCIIHDGWMDRLLWEMTCLHMIWLITKISFHCFHIKPIIQKGRVITTTTQQTMINFLFCFSFYFLLKKMIEKFNMVIFVFVVVERVFVERHHDIFQFIRQVGFQCIFSESFLKCV